MNIPSNPMGRYSDSYQSQGKPLRITGACCSSKTCNGTKGCGCGCGGGQPRYSATTPGAASGQAATMMMPNIVINVQSGNRRSNDYTDAHNANTSYSDSEANPYLYAPTSTENNPYFSSFEHGGNYSSGRYTGTDRNSGAPTAPDTEVLPIVLSPRAAAKAKQAFNPGPKPEYVGRRYPLEFP